MAARDFPRFRDLPTELRLQIWSHCLPGPRVFEMDYPQSDNHHTLPAGDGYGRELWSSPSGQTPLVSRVCREARSVVVKHHRYVTDDKAQTDEEGTPYPPWTGGWNVNLPVRFRKGFDIVHLNWHVGYDRHDWFPPPPCPLPTFQWLANQAAAASVSADLLLPFDPERDNPYTIITTIAYEDIEYFSPHVLYYVVLANVEIHISAEEAAQAGVFGALGEEPIRLVDPRDTATVAKFRDAWRCRQLPSDEELDVAEFFSRAIDAADVYCVRVEQWRQNLEKMWLWGKGINLGISLATDAEIWPNLLTEDEDEDGNEIETPSSWHVNWSRRKLDREHPWVQTQLPLIPRFEPALMFRHCIGRCGLPGYAKPL